MSPLLLLPSLPRSSTLDTPHPLSEGLKSLGIERNPPGLGLRIVQLPRVADCNPTLPRSAILVSTLKATHGPGQPNEGDPVPRIIYTILLGVLVPDLPLPTRVRVDDNPFYYNT